MTAGRQLPAEVVAAGRTVTHARSSTIDSDNNITAHAELPTLGDQSRDAGAAGFRGLGTDQSAFRARNRDPNFARQTIQIPLYPFAEPPKKALRANMAQTCWGLSGEDIATKELQ